MRVLTAFLLLSQAAAATALIYDALFPREEPMVTRDPRECNFLNLHPYFSGPTPTGALETALISYGDELNKDCPWTDRDVMGLRTCPYPAQSVWCAFSKSAPASVLPAWSAHGSEAASWWGKHSSEIVEYAQMCPKKWFYAMISAPYGSIRLNNTINWAGCYVEAHPTGDNKVLKTPAPKSNSATTGMKASETGPAETERPTGDSNGVGRRAEDPDLWKVAGTGLAAMAVNSVLSGVSI
ncbi:hypothetical protein NW754_013656 [Fusarium falciforme]|nr:hypothetical protein NW754_013656 [Fusarium falciforme]